MPDPSDQIRARLQNAIRLLDSYARRPGSFQNELLDLLAVVGLAEAELDTIRAVAHHELRGGRAP
jgi:hypothetical protein